MNTIRLQRLRIEQVKGTAESYQNFGEQLLKMADAWKHEVYAENGQKVFTLPRAYTMGYLGLKIFVNGQLQPANTTYVETNPTTITFNEPLFDTDVVTFRVEGAGSGTTFVSDHGHVFREVPTGNKNGINKTFMISRIPIGGSECIFQNGILLSPVDDYLISGDTFVFVEAPVSDDKIIVNYLYSMRG